MIRLAVEGNIAGDLAVDNKKRYFNVLPKEMRDLSAEETALAAMMKPRLRERLKPEIFEYMHENQLV